MTLTEKIKALLAKAAGTDNEAEAELFFSKAHELMDKHQLSVNDLEQDDPMGEDKAYARKGRVVPDWDFRLMFAVARYFGCRAIKFRTFEDQSKNINWLGHHMALIGRESARVTTVEMHLYLVSTVRKLGRERAAELGVKPDQAARQIGNALKLRLEELNRANAPAAVTKSGQNALVTLDAIKLWLEKNHPNLSNIRSKTFTSEAARGIANGIGLNLQTTGRDVRRLA